METNGIIDSKTSATLQWLNFLMNEMSTEDLISEATKHNKIIAEAVEQGDKDGIGGALSYWRALFMEALERRDKVAHHRWMTRVMNEAIDPTPFFCPPKEDGQTPENEAGHEGECLKEKGE